MGYEHEPRRLPKLTPLESELRVPQPPRPARAGPWRRFRMWRAHRRPPTTLRGAVALGLLRLAVAGAVGSVAALLLAHWLNRPTPVGFYIAGAALLAVAFMSSASNMGPRYYSDRSEREYHVRASFSYALVGAVLIAVAVVLERSS